MSNWNGYGQSQSGGGYGGDYGGQGGYSGGGGGGYGSGGGGGYGSGGGGGGYGGGGFGGGGGNSFEFDISCRDVPRVIGRGGSKIKELEQESGCRIKIRKDKDNGVTTGVELIGDSDAQTYAKQLIDDFLATPSYGGGRGGGGGGGFGGQSFGGGRSFGGGGGGGGGFAADGDSREIEIPTNCVGRIIGKGGSKIRELQDDSGARIKVLKDREVGQNTIVQLFGSDSAKDRAKELIDELVCF